MITTTQIEQFKKEGYFIMEKALSEDQLELLREECFHFIDKMHEKMDEAGTDVIEINHRNKRYFLSHTNKESERMRSFIFSSLMAEICRATLGENACFFLDQFVVKAAEIGMKFAWHQDSGYIPFDHEPYVTCWTPLDDVSEENGTVYLLPFSELGIKSRVTHEREEGTNDMVGYWGDNPGVPVIVPAGSVAVFSSVCFHRSGANRSDKMRRVMLTQYSKAPIVNSFTGERLFQGIPFLENGNIVYSEKTPVS